MSGTEKREVKRKGSRACGAPAPLQLRKHPLQTPRCPPQTTKHQRGAQRNNTILPRGGGLSARKKFGQGASARGDGRQQQGRGQRTETAGTDRKKQNKKNKRERTREMIAHRTPRGITKQNDARGGGRRRTKEDTIRPAQKQRAKIFSKTQNRWRG